jgi:hypothetical protein
MAFNIEEFRGRIGQRGILQTNKYAVQISFGVNSAMNGTAVTTLVNGPVPTSKILDDLQYRCVSASLPGVALRTVDSARYGVGVQEKMPFSSNFTDVDLTFICDRFGMTHAFLYTWLNYIFTTNGATPPGYARTGGIAQLDGRKFYTTEYKDNYAGNIQIVVYDTAGLPSITYNLYRAFPIALNDIPVSWEQQNGLLKVTAKFSFTEWSLDDFGTTLDLNAPIQSFQSSPLNQPNNSAVLRAPQSSMTA